MTCWLVRFSPVRPRAAPHDHNAEEPAGALCFLPAVQAQGRDRYSESCLRLRGAENEIPPHVRVYAASVSRVDGRAGHIVGSVHGLAVSVVQKVPLPSRCISK